MNVLVHPSKLKGTISAIPSKSVAHRQIICAALGNDVSHIGISSLSKDITATIVSMEALGAKFDYSDNVLTVHPIDRNNLPVKAVLDCNESGSTLRFLFPLVCALGIEGTFKTAGRLSNRPMSPLFKILNEKGVETGNTESGFYCKGNLGVGEYVIEGNISSQYISGLLFGLSVLEGKSKVLLSTPLESAPYVNLTLDALESCGIKVSKTNEGEFGGYVVEGGTFSSIDTVVEGDWSNASFWLSAGVSVKGLKGNSAQGDKDILNVIEKMGGCVSTENGVFSAQVNNLHSTEIDATDIPDAVPIISVLSATAKGVTVINNISRLRLKESDRVATVCNMLNSLGINTESDQNTMKIYGGCIKGGVVDCANDHRIAMAAAIAGVFAQSDITLIGAEAVNKSYPNFFEDYKTLGGLFDVL